MVPLAGRTGPVPVLGWPWALAGAESAATASAPAAIDVSVRARRLEVMSIEVVGKASARDASADGLGWRVMRCECAADDTWLGAPTKVRCARGIRWSVVSARYRTDRDRPPPLCEGVSCGKFTLAMATRHRHPLPLSS